MIDPTLPLARRLLALARTGLLAGLALAAFVYPFAALAGLSIKQGADTFASDSEQLRATPPAQTTRG